MDDRQQSVPELCASGKPVPAISETKAYTMLKNIKPEVDDLYSITARHYLNVGPSDMTPPPHQYFTQRCQPLNHHRDQ